MHHAQIRERLMESGLKPTHQRIVIYETVHHMHSHPTAEEIFDRLRGEHPTLSLGTVYRTLEKLVEAGLCKKVSSPDGVMLFDGNAETHHHLVCQKRRHIQDFVDPELTRLIGDYLRNKQIEGFEVAEFQLQIFGQCTDD